LTAYTEIGSGRGDPFPTLVDRAKANAFDIEHIFADQFGEFASEFANEHEFQEWRNHVASLLLLPADVNRSLQDKSFAQKAPHYAKQNFFAASLDASAYQHQPQFEKFRSTNGFAFEPFEKFGKEEQLKRRALVEALVHQVWSPTRLEEAAQ
jgi:Protein of unknown function (DUF1524)